MSERTQAHQKAVRFDGAAIDPGRTANYNLRPRKRRNEGRAESAAQQVKGGWKPSRRKPTPYAVSWRRMKLSEPEAKTSSAQRRDGNKSAKRKTTRYGQRRRRRKALCNQEKEFLGTVRAAAFHSKYQELHMIGRGGFGYVFAGYRLADKLPVAVKHIPRRNIYTKLMDEHGNRVPSEVALMLKLSWEEAEPASHVQLLDWYDLFTEVILVLERPAPCINLFHYCRCGDSQFLEEDRAKVIMKQVIQEVKLLDRKSIFHRDLKLENILINTNSEEPRIWIIDFGVGCFFTERSVYRVFQGTPQHAPPEYNCWGRYRAGPTTVWQLGAVLFEMLHDKDFSTIPFLLNELLIDDDLSDECLDFLEKCLEVFPASRMTLEEMLSHPWFREKPPTLSHFTMLRRQLKFY